MEKTIKCAYICKGVQDFQIESCPPANYTPQDGDVAVFEVIKIGKHKTIQSHTKRNVTIIPGDYFLATFGSRYATAQFEGYLPESINGELHILGAGGTVGIIRSMHYDYIDIGPTTLRCIGLAVDGQGRVINTKQLCQPAMLPFRGAAAAATKVVLSLGSSMDSGKTTSAAYLVHGLKAAGYRVAFIKLTGTVYTKDCDLVFDLGADVTADFSDMGFPSTYLCSQEELLNLYESLLVKVMSCQPDYVVMEIADGIYQRETKMLLQHAPFRDSVEAVLFSAGDSLAAINGLQVLDSWGIHPFAISGLLTASPLLVKEVQEYTNTTVLNIEQLSDKGVAGYLQHQVKLGMTN
jgi:hypothetical protein